ncbi:hypothetical protein [Actinomyces faecalis]|uniref:hypothetical protein n=1 Tax=Actinomyces faecalis TaxID=2722820 RepID=UPI001552B8B8|nr:hypothetical protein [Actinomyces faecalis]
MSAHPAFQPRLSQPYAGVDRLTVGQALTWSWRRIADNPAPLLAGFAIWTILTGGGISVSYLGSGSADSGGLITTIAMILSPIPFAHVGLLTAAGGQARIRDFFAFPNLWPMVLAGILTSVLQAIGFVFLIVPGLILLYLWHFTQLVGVDRGLEATDAMRESWRILSGNASALVPFALVGTLLGVAGVVTGLGWVLTTPLVSLMSAYAYVTATGRVVAG